MQNITRLCTSDCQRSLKDWLTRVERYCAGQTTSEGGVTVEAKALVLSFTYNAETACLQSRCVKPP